MEENKEYLNEEQFQKNKQSVKKVGKILLIIGGIITILGIALIIMGFIGMGNSFGSASINETSKGVFGNFGMTALGMFTTFIGTAMLMFGGLSMVIAHRREITSFTTQQVMPVAKEGIEKMAPTVGNVAKEVTKGIKEGLDEANKNSN